MTNVRTILTGPLHRNRQVILLLVALAAPYGFRAAIWSESAVSFGTADLQGLYVDLCVTGIWVLLVILASGKSRVTAYVLMAFWCWLHAANYEHVRALGALPSLSQVGQLANSNFLWGSALVVSRPYLLAVLLLLNLMAVRLIQKAPQLVRPSLWFTATMLGMCLGLPLCDDFKQSASWRQTHPLASNLAQRWKYAFSPVEPAVPAVEDVRERVGQLVRADLSGQLILSPAKRPRNVLLVVLEGISGAHIEPISRIQGLNYHSPLPKLSRLASENFAWSQFVTQQRQTDRGLYAIIAGRYPPLDRSPSSVNDYVSDPQHPALPAVLREVGYETVFLQAADLDYMQKGRFMKLAGFNRVLGSESFESAPFMTLWGPDDRTVMEKGYELIQSLKNRPNPWFLTVFTAGTHHPYEVPGGFQSRFEPDTFEHAAAYADAAVAELLTRLRRDGTLDQTLVLITSDESCGLKPSPGDLDAELSQNWGFLVAIIPHQVGRCVDEPFMQSDLALSIVDFLGLADQSHRLAGRSVFRHYEKPRPILCGNVYFGTVILFDIDGTLSIWADDLRSGRTYRRGGRSLFGGAIAAQAWDPSKSNFVSAVVRDSHGQEFDRRKSSSDLEPTSLSPGSKGSGVN